MYQVSDTLHVNHRNLTHCRGVNLSHKYTLHQFTMVVHGMASKYLNSVLKRKVNSSIIKSDSFHLNDSDTT